MQTSGDSDSSQKMRWLVGSARSMASEVKTKQEKDEQFDKKISDLLEQMQNEAAEEMKKENKIDQTTNTRGSDKHKKKKKKKQDSFWISWLFRWRHSTSTEKAKAKVQDQGKVQKEGGRSSIWLLFTSIYWPKRINHKIHWH